MTGYLVRSNHHINHAWIMIDKEKRYHWIYSHRDATVFKTKLHAMIAGIFMQDKWKQDFNIDLEFSIVSNESLDSMYGEFAKFVPETR